MLSNLLDRGRLQPKFNLEPSDRRSKFASRGRRVPRSITQIHALRQRVTFLRTNHISTVTTATLRCETHERHCLDCQFVGAALRSPVMYLRRVTGAVTRFKW